VLAASLIVELRIVEHHHESSVHVILLMAVQESLTRIVGHKLYLDGSTGVNQDDILAQPCYLRAIFKPPDLKCVRLCR
jgi:hypothetical protein